MAFKDEEHIELYDCDSHVEIGFKDAGIWPFEWSDKDLAQTAVDQVVRSLQEPLRELGASDEFTDDDRSEKCLALLNWKDVWVSFPADSITMKLVRQVRQLVQAAVKEAEESAGIIHE